MKKKLAPETESMLLFIFHSFGEAKETYNTNVVLPTPSDQSEQLFISIDESLRVISPLPTVKYVRVSLRYTQN